MELSKRKLQCTNAHDDNTQHYVGRGSVGGEKKKKWTHFEGPLLRGKYFGHQRLFELVKVDFHGMILMVMT